MPIQNRINSSGGPIQLWQFLVEMLLSRESKDYITWTGKEWEFRMGKNHKKSPHFLNELQSIQMKWRDAGESEKTNQKWTMKNYHVGSDITTTKILSKKLPAEGTKIAVFFYQFYFKICLQIRLPARRARWPFRKRASRDAWCRARDWRVTVYFIFSL